MIQGFNHNIKYKGRIYHVQTEDNGKDHPYIITHVFIGGNILASRKVSYLDIAVNENAPEIIRDMMKEQHKAMVKELITGALDSKLPSAPVTTEKGNATVAAPDMLETAQAVKSESTEAASVLDSKEAKANAAGEKSLDEVILDFLSKDGE